MSKKISRTLIIGFFLCIIIISYAVDMILLSMFSCFWLGFVISAIIAKEQDHLMFWAGSRGIPTGSFDKGGEHERPKRKSDGKAEQET